MTCEHQDEWKGKLAVNYKCSIFMQTIMDGAKENILSVIACRLGTASRLVAETKHLIPGSEATQRLGSLKI